MFVSCETSVYRAQNAQTEYMLDVVRDLWRVQMPPWASDTETVAVFPIMQIPRFNLQPCFFENLTCCSLQRRFSDLQATSNRLPLAGRPDAFDQQELLVGGVDHNENGNWIFVALYG